MSTRFLALMVVSITCAPFCALADEPVDSLFAPGAMADTSSAVAAPVVPSASAPDTDQKESLIYLVPVMEDAGFKITKDKNRFRHRISFSPAFGKLGSEDLFAFRVGYSPNTWIGYEASFGHNPASELHALLHTFNVVLRYPFGGRFQPYATLGYGMMTVYPGQAINADPVTKNALTAGGGLEIYIRDDVSLRGEVRGATILGQQLNVEGTVAYDYMEYTIGFAFYRSLGS